MQKCSRNVTTGGFITARAKEFPNDIPVVSYLYSRCTVSGLEGVRAYLGRAFRPYSTVVYLSQVVEPAGWSPWHYQGHE